MFSKDFTNHIKITSGLHFPVIFYLPKLGFDFQKYKHYYLYARARDDFSNETIISVARTNNFYFFS